MADLKPLTHLAIDTSALIGAGWPTLAPEADSVFGTCEALKLPVLIPELVLIEAEAVWKRNAQESIRKAKEAMDIVARRGLLDGSVTKWPDEKSIATEYKTRRAAFTRKYEVPSIPNTLSLQEAVTLAAFAVPPFPEGDDSFRDALITVSLFDAVNAGAQLAFLTTDKGFKAEGYRDAAKQKGIGFHLFSSWRDVLEPLEMLAINSKWLEEFKQAAMVQESLLHAVRKRHGDLQAFVKANLRIPEYPDLSTGRVIAVYDVEVTDIRSVHISPFTATPSPIADVALSVTARVEPPFAFRSRNVGVGESLDAQTLGTLATIGTLISGGSLPSLAETPISFKAFATVGLRLLDDKDPPSFEFTSVEFETAAIRGLKRAALIKKLKG